MSPDITNTIFQKAVSFVNQTNKHLFISGKAGTGKTTFLKYIKAHSHKKMAVVAPTGVAAINAGGMTLHSFFQLPMGIFLPIDGGQWGSYNSEVNNRSTLLKNLRIRGNKRNVIRELDLLVIDEISMVRADLLDAIDTVLRHIRKQPLLPFGGVQMIYIGDLFQLPPVARQEEWSVLNTYYKSPFFFDAKAIEQAPPLYIELKKIYRQKDDVFINILNNVRNNCCTENDLEILHQNYQPTFIPKKEDNYIILTSHNSKADQINQNELSKLPGKAYSYIADVHGDFNERSYPAEKDLKLKVGAQIMFIKNDKGEARRFYNGKLGTVKALEKEKITVVFPHETDEIELEQEKWENIKYTYDNQEDKLKEEALGSFTQYPIRLAWAITIHKSQGLTFEKAIVDAGASFAAGQVYVSLSRLTSIQGLVLHSKILPGSISTDSRVIEYLKAEKDEDELQKVLEAEQRVYIRQSLLNTFNWEKINEATRDHLEEYENRQFPGKEKCEIWAKKLSFDNVNLSEVAGKFARQLENMFLTCEEDHYKSLYERMKVACAYFIKEMDEKLITPSKEHIATVKVKKQVKRYVKDLQDLQDIFYRKKQQIQQTLLLSEALYQSDAIENLLEMVARSKMPQPKPENEIAELNKQKKKEKGESNEMSLQLFKQGKTIAEIAEERAMAFSTIESHLSSFIISGEVDVLDVVEKEIVDEIIQILKAEPHLKPGEIRQKTSEFVSFGKIKAAMNYWELLKTPDQ